MVHTQAATAAAAWGATATRWRDQLSTTAGEIITFAVRRVLLLVILYTMELPVIKPALHFGHKTAHLGVKGIGAALDVVHTMTNVSVNALRGLWNSTSESEEDGRVYIEQPQHHRRADPNLDKKKLRKITTPHLRAIDAYIEWANRFYGQVTVAHVQNSCGARARSARLACGYPTATSQPPASTCAWASTGARTARGRPGCWVLSHG